MSLTAERPLTGLSEQESAEGTIKGEQERERGHGDLQGQSKNYLQLDTTF